MNQIEKKIILDIPIASLTFKQIVETIISQVQDKGKKTFFYVNAHCLNLAVHDKEYSQILRRADLVYSGGLGPIIASKSLGLYLKERTPTPDFIEKIFEEAQTKNWTFYFIGTAKASLTKAVDNLKIKFPNLEIKGFHHGFFSNKEGWRLIQDINQKKPTFIIVGMGTPKQEKWISENIDKIDAKIFWGVGAMFDVISGELPRAPKWIQNLGLEWLYRLFQEPKRLWKRYTLGNLQFVFYIFRQRFSNFKFSKIFLVITLLEILVISYLIVSIFQKYNSNILGATTSVYPLKISDYSFSPGTRLEHFYEPLPNSIRTDKVDWLNYQTTYQLNNEGFNESENFLLEKPVNTFRVITLGDSHTFGVFVDPNQNYSSQLEKNLQNKKCSNIDRFEVINLGVPGYDLDYAIERFAKRGLKYSPDLVIWLIKEDDVFQINDFLKEKSDQLKKEMEANGELKKYQSQGIYYPYRILAQKQLLKDVGFEKILALQKSNLDYFSSLYSGKLLIFSYPYNLTIYGPMLEEYTKERPLTFFYQTIPELSKDSQILPDGHPNSSGHKFIADQLLNFIDSNNIITCNLSVR